MWIDFALVASGLVILVLSGDALVKGAVNLALRAGVPALLVSLSVVAFGTSLPELIVSVQAILDGAPGLALGNVVGSNIANVLLVLGLPAMISGLRISGSDSRKSYATMMAVTVVFIGLALTHEFNRIDGSVLLVLFALFLADMFRTARRHRAGRGAQAGDPPVQAETSGSAGASVPAWKICIWLLLGLIGLPLGADLLVDGAVNIAHALDVPETVIGLTLVALGTSLPELATSVVAAVRGESEVAVGNVIGSNLFNLLAIIGVSSMVGPIPVDPQILRFDIWVMLLSSAALAPYVFLKLDMGRVAGMELTATYVGFVVRAVC